MRSSGSDSRFSHSPSHPPPGSVPQYCGCLKNTGPEYISQCMKHFIYAWTKFGNSFWIYPVDIRDGILFCHAWDGNDWRYIQLPVDLIDSFC